MKVLYVLPYVPHQCASGPQGPKNFTGPILRELARRVNLHLVIIGKSSDRLYAEQFAHSIPELHNFNWYDAAEGFVRSIKRVKSVLSGYPATVGEYNSSELYNYIKLNHKNFDIVHFEYYNMATYARALDAGFPSVLMCHDAYSLGVSLARKYSYRVKDRLSLWLRWWLFKNYERRVYSCISIVNTVSPVDSRYLKNLGIENVAYVPVGLPSKTIALNAYKPQQCSIPSLLVVVPSGKCLPKEVVWFMEDGLSLLERRYGPMNVTIFGPGADAAKKCCSTNLLSHVDYVLRAEDYSSFLNDDWIYLYLLRAGSGLHTKLLDAMNFGIPVVGYPEIMDSFQGRSGVEYFSSTTSAELLDNIGKLYTSVDLRISVGHAAKQMVSSEYSATNSANIVVSQYGSLAQ